MSCNNSNRGKVKNIQNEGFPFFFIQDSVFRHVLSVLHFVPRYLQSALSLRQKLRLVSENLLNQLLQ